MSVRAYKVASPANVGKEARVVALLPFWRVALGDVTRFAYRNFTLQGLSVPKRFSLKTMNLSTPLSARHVNSVWVQAYGALTAWEVRVQDAFRSRVAGSTMDDFTRVTLYRVNQYRAWFREGFTLPMWVDPVTGELTHQKQGASVQWVVPERFMRLARHVAKHSIKRQPLPIFTRVNTMLMDGNVAKLEQSNTTHDAWLRVSTLTKGKPVLIPLKLSKYAKKRAGEWNNGAQITVHGDTVRVTLTKTLPDAQPRTEGDTIGLDWGLVNLFTDSRGNQYGQTLYTWLKERDKELTTLTRNLQQHRIKPKQSTRYNNLNRRIREHVKNEVGRILNRLTQQNIKTLAVENLDFRHGGLSPQLNRILTRAGRGAIRTKLKDLTETHGVTITPINPAYTSQQCSNCGWVAKQNRTTQQTFHCTKCHKKLNADVNAARNIKGRSLNGTAWLYVKREKIREELLVRYHKHNACDTPTTVGLVEHPSTTGALNSTQPHTIR